jgi:hypothetical protein
VQTRSTSRATTKTDPIILRGGGREDQVRLVFMPTIVENPHNESACVNGDFVWEKKLQKDVWIPLKTERLSALKSGQGYCLHLNTNELLILVRELQARYLFHSQHGVPQGQQTWVSAKGPIGELLTQLESLAPSGELGSELIDDAAKAVSVLLRGLSRSPHGQEAITRLMALNPDELPSLNAILGLGIVKDALSHWRANQNNGDEGFWKKSLKERAYVLSQVFVYPIIVIDDQAYVGGKQIDNRGGSLVDFLARVESTGQVVLIEIKTPQTPLLGTKYRNDVYPLSKDLAGGIAQALKYRQRFISSASTILGRNRQKLVVGAPRCLLVAGNTEREFARDANDSMRDDFELLREQCEGVTIITYDELFTKMGRTVSLLEGTNTLEPRAQDHG